MIFPGKMLQPNPTHLMSVTSRCEALSAAHCSRRVVSKYQCGMKPLLITHSHTTVTSGYCTFLAFLALRIPKPWCEIYVTPTLPFPVNGCGVEESGVLKRLLKLQIFIILATRAVESNLSGELEFDWVNFLHFFWELLLDSGILEDLYIF